MSGYQLAGNAPAAYVRFASKILEPWTDDLIEAARCRDGDRVLDAACGTGLVASRIALVSRKNCTVVGIDTNEGMLTVARHNPAIEWHQGNATELPFDAGSFDVVLCQQGLQYFSNRSAAMREMARVLVPVGRIAVAVWGRLERHPFHAALVDGIGMFLGSEAKSAFDLAFSLNTADELRSLGRESGFEKVHVRFEHRTARHPSPKDLVEGFLASTPVAAQVLALPDDRKTALVGHITDRLGSYIDDDGLAVSQENHFLTASKPVQKS